MNEIKKNWKNIIWALIPIIALFRIYFLLKIINRNANNVFTSWDMQGLSDCKNIAVLGGIFGLIELLILWVLC